MPIQVICPGCKASFQAKDEWAGRKTKCPKCAVEIVIGQSMPTMSSSTKVDKAKPAPAATAPDQKSADTAKPAEAAKPAAAAAKPMVKAKRIHDPAAPHAAAPPSGYGYTQPGYYPEQQPYPPAGYGQVPAYGAPPYGGVPQPYGAAPYPLQPYPPQQYGYPPPAYGMPPQPAQVDAYGQPLIPGVPSPSEVPGLHVDLNAAPAGVAKHTAIKTSATKSKSSPVATGSMKPWSPLLLAGVGFVVVFLVLVGLFFFRDRDEAKNDVVVNTKPSAATPPKKAAPLAASGPEELADVVERLKTGIVLITLMDSKGDTLGLGTGFLINNRKQVITNYHVVEGGSRGIVRFSNALTTEIRTVVAVDKARDLAIVELDFVPDDAVPLSLAPEATLRQGTKVIAIGHPRGLDYSVTEGIVSALRTTVELPEGARDFLEAPDDQQWIQTSAAISGGNSGGPLMLPDGRVVGINTWVAGGENLGFAGHVRHILELTKKAATPLGATLADYNAKNGGLDRAVVDDIDAFAVGYGELLKRAETAGWRPTNAENAAVILQAAAGTTIARNNGLVTTELSALSESLRNRTWKFSDDVRLLNLLTIASLRDQRAAGVMFFGKVISVQTASKPTYQVRLAGRGYDLEVVEDYDSREPKQVGDQVLVMGLRPAGAIAAVQVIMSGLAIKANYEAPPPEAALRECADYVQYLREFEALTKLLAAPERNFPQIRLTRQSETREMYDVTLNADGHQFDAVRIPASAGAADDDAWLAVVLPKAGVLNWGLTTIDGGLRLGEVRCLEVKDLAGGQLTFPRLNKTFLIPISGDDLKNSKRHLLWFLFPDDKPAPVKITGIYRPRGATPPTPKEVFDAIGLQMASGGDALHRNIMFGRTDVPGAPGMNNEPTVAAIRYSLGGQVLNNAEAGRMPAAGTRAGMPTPSATAGSGRTITLPDGRSITIQPRGVGARNVQPISGSSYSVSYGNRASLSSGIPSLVKFGPDATNAALPRDALPMTLAVRPETSSALLALPTGWSISITQSVTMALVPDDVGSTAAANMSLLRERGATVVALALPPGATAGRLETLRVDESSRPSDEYREPLFVLLDGAPVSPTDAEAIAAMPYLSLVSLRNCVVDRQVAVNLMSAPRILMFVAQNTPIDDQAVAEAKFSDRLYAVFLDYTNVGNSSAEILLKNEKIDHISLRGTKIDGRCLQALPSGRDLNSLDLSDTAVDDLGIRNLSRVKRLHTLNLANLKIGVDGLRELAKIQTLLRLDLEGVAITPEMLEILCKMHRLSQLHLDNSGLTDAQLNRLKERHAEYAVRGR